VLALLLCFDLLQTVEFAEQHAPLRLQTCGGEAVFQGFAQDKRQERAEYVAERGWVSEGNPSFRSARCRLDAALDHTKIV